MSNIAEEWSLMKLDLAKLIHAGKVEPCLKFLQELHRDFEHTPQRQGELIGMLFILEVLKAGEGQPGGYSK